MQPTRPFSRIRPALLALLFPIGVAACAGLDRSDRGNLQPQTVAGACNVKKFFILSLSTTPTDMTVANNGGGCTFTVFNPDLQIVTTAALVTSPPSHGEAAVGLLLGGRQAAVSYRPQPGYTGPDSFAVTLEPRDRGITLHVTVQPG